MTDAICSSLAAKGVSAEVVEGVRGILLTAQEFEVLPSDISEDVEEKFAVQRAAIAFKPSQLAQISLSEFFSQDMDTLLSLSQACGLITVPTNDFRACGDELVTAFLKSHSETPGGLEPHQLCLDDINLSFGDPYEADSSLSGLSSISGVPSESAEGVRPEPKLLPGQCLDLSASSLIGLSFSACLGEAIPDITVIDLTANQLLSCQQVRDFIVQGRFTHLQRCILTGTLISPDELRVSLAKCDGFQALAHRLVIEKDEQAEKQCGGDRAASELAQDALVAKAAGVPASVVSDALAASAPRHPTSLAARLLQEPLLFAEDIPFEAERKFMCQGIAFRSFDRELLACLKRHEDLFPMLTSLFIQVPDEEPLSGAMLPSQVFFLNGNLIRGTLVEGKYVDGELTLAAEPFKQLPQRLEDKIYEACRVIHVGSSPVPGEYDMVSGNYLYDETVKEDFLVAVFPGFYANQNNPPTHESVPSLSKNSIGIVGLTDNKELAFIWASLRDRPLGRDVRYPVLLQGTDHYCGANRVALACKYSQGNAHLIRVPLSYPGSGLGGFLRAKLHIFCEKVCDTHAWRDWCSQHETRLAKLAGSSFAASVAAPKAAEAGGEEDSEGRDENANETVEDPQEDLSFLDTLRQKLFCSSLAFESTVDGISCFCRVVSFLQNEALVPFTILDDSLRMHSSAAKCLVLMLCRAIRHVTILPASGAYFYSVYEAQITSCKPKKVSLISKVIQAVPGSEGELPARLREAAKAQKETGADAQFDLPEMDRALENLLSDIPGADMYDGVYSIHCAYAAGVVVVSSVERHQGSV